jgi:uncharacterized protein (DUF3084 family)
MTENATNCDPRTVIMRRASFNAQCMGMAHTTEVVMARSKQVQQLETTGQTLILVAHRYENMEKALQAIEQKAGVVEGGNVSWGGALREIAHMAQEALKDG